MKPQRSGWHWFLPDDECPTPTGFLRIDTPVVVLVGVDKVTRDMPPARLVVRFPQGMLYVDDMSGDWEEIKTPQHMKDMARTRLISNMGKNGNVHG